MRTSMFSYGVQPDELTLNVIFPSLLYMLHLIPFHPRV
jgi:hypothetical protein